MPGAVVAFASPAMASRLAGSSGPKSASGSFGHSVARHPGPGALGVDELHQPARELVELERLGDEAVEATVAGHALPVLVRIAGDGYRRQVAPVVALSELSQQGAA